MSKWTDRVIKPIVRGIGESKTKPSARQQKVLLDTLKRTASQGAARTLRGTARTMNAYANQSGGGGGGGRGGGGGGGGWGGYGGGNDGPSAYELWKIEQEKRRERELALRKEHLTNQLKGARNEARPLLNQYANQYNSQIGNIFRQNRSQNSGYANQLKAIQNQMNTQTRGTEASLFRDLQGQGAGAGDLQAMQQGAQQNVAGANFMGLLGNQYNNRLAQVMNNRHADARSMGATVKASSKGQLENSYAQLLGQIGMIGLGR